MRLTALGALLAVVLLAPPSGAQEHFPSPEAAARAFTSATRSGKPERLMAVLGPESDEIVSSGDPAEDAAARKRFTTAAGERTRIETMPDGAMAILHVGRDDWPFPIPLVKDTDGWRFDTAAGKQELLNRRIGRNELVAIQVCRAYVAAQFEYAKRFHAYAQSLRSTPGKRDGLYWEATDHDASPLGPFVAAATTEGYHVPEGDEPRVPYHGYFFRVLTSQGPHAPGGARDYVKDGKMTGGFALVAWPADHGSSGIMTFVVSEQDVVFQKDLGEQTDAAAKAMTAYDPDGSWDPTK